jgi:hypothetical protein
MILEICERECERERKPSGWLDRRGEITLRTPRR